MTIRVERKLIFGDAGQMGTEADVMRDIEGASAAAEAIERRESAMAAAETEAQKMQKRGMRGIKVIA
jgi:hypothetical protein